jgi:hypothetical protein
MVNMPIPLQLYLLPEDNTELAVLKREIEEVDLTCNKVRKALFARHNELAKLYLEIHQRLEFIESNLCKGKYEII